MTGKIKGAIIVGCILAALVAAGLLVPRLLNQPVKGIPKGWSAIAGSIDDWTWKEGKIHGHAGNGESMLVSGKTYRDVTISANASSANREASFVVRAQDAQNCYLVIFVPSNTGWRKGDGWIELVKRVDGKEQLLNSYKGRTMSTLGHTARITTIAKGPWIEVQLNDVTVIRQQDTTYSSGFVGLRIFGKGNQPCDAQYSYLRFY